MIICAIDGTENLFKGENMGETKGMVVVILPTLSLFDMN